jgi:hypothetical protein
MAKQIYDFYSDPGHGWLKVSREELEELGLKETITPFSYQRGKDVFLEEDCDASAFFLAKQEKHGVTIKFRDHYAGERTSKIRNYPSYTPA